MRPFTFDEWARFVLAATRVRDDVDETLGNLLLQVADGDDSALAAVHDRLVIIGREDVAERVRKMLPKGSFSRQTDEEKRVNEQG